MERLKRKLKGLALCFVIVVAIVAIRALYEQFDSRRYINDDTVERNITSIVHNFPKAPDLEEKVRPWDSELPALIAKDIEYVEKEPLLNWISYKFYEWRFYIHIDSDGEPYITMDGNAYPYLYDFRNFSFYSTKKDGKDALVLYGYDLNAFECYMFYEGDYDFTFMTYNETIPFKEKESFAYTRGDYTVCFPHDRDVVYVYKDGKVVSDEYAIPHNCQTFYNGFIVDENGDMEMLFVVEGEDGEVGIIFEPVGKLQDANEPYRSMEVEGISNIYIELPAFQDGDKMVVPTPKDWDTFIAAKKGETPDHPNYEMELIYLDEDHFKRVEFEVQKNGIDSSARWYANIFYDVNGKEIMQRYAVNGYDSYMPCPSELPEKKTVTTKGEFWDFITTIRETYKLYYDYPDGE